MQIVCMSDTHWNLPYLKGIPDGDVLIHAGDFLSRGTLSELKSFIGWLHEQPHQHKIVVAGNHDWICAELSPKEVQEIFGKEAHYLCDDGVIIENKVFYGTPYQPQFMNWAFNLPRSGEELRKKMEAIPIGTDVLITHSPPKGILDIAKGTHVGCEMLFDRVRYVKPALHVFGHIHEGAGEAEFEGTKFINASICDEKYMISHSPSIVEL